MCKLDEATQALSEAMDCSCLYKCFTTRELYAFIRLETGICANRGTDPALWVPLIAKKRIVRRRGRHVG